MNDHATMSPAGVPVPPAGGNRPEPADDFEVLLITGMSGAGRSHAADCVEDMGWYVVDNLPPKLLVPLVDMMTNAGKDGVHKLAAVIDVRSREYFDDLSAMLSHLDDLGVRARILFLDASDEVLIKRYESVRRPHPLQRGNRLIDGILEERSLLDNLKERADMVIDTSSLSIHQLSTKLYEAMLGSGPSTVAVHIFSFGFKYGMPIDADFVADVRFLPAEPILGADAARAQRARQARQRLRAVKSGCGRFPGRIRAGHPRGVGRLRSRGQAFRDHRHRMHGRAASFRRHERGTCEAAARARHIRHRIGTRAAPGARIARPCSHYANISFP